MNTIHDVLPLLCIEACITLKDVQLKKISGGSINEVYHINDVNGKQFCCKLNSATKFPHLFQHEANGLQLLSFFANTPAVIGCVETETVQALLLQWIEPSAPTPQFWESFGASIAHLHRTEGCSFRLHFNNYMGSVPQCNEPLPTWPLFFSERRLLPVMRICYDQHLLDSKDKEGIALLADRLSHYFEPITPRLVHGDLWSGNFLCSKTQTPVLIDPAPYYGHPAWTWV